MRRPTKNEQIEQLQARIIHLEREVFLVRQDRDNLAAEARAKLLPQRAEAMRSIAEITDAIAHAIKFAVGGEGAI